MDQISQECSIQNQCGVMLEIDSNKNLCPFCYEICKNRQGSITNKINANLQVKQASFNKCQCDHSENSHEFFKNVTRQHFDQQSSYRQIAAFNCFIGETYQGETILEKYNKDVQGMMVKDNEALQNQSFRWEDIDAEQIELRANTINVFNNDHLNNDLLPIIHMVPLQQVYSLQFIDMVTENPNYSFGQPIYNQSLNFYSYLLQFFCTHYLEKDFQLLDRIESKNINKISPLTRLQIRQKNQQNLDIREKYFDGEFNLFQFAVKCLKKFIPGASWRWIGGNHKAHIYSIYICILLIEYGLLSTSEFDTIKDVLYQKVHILRFLEDIIDKDSQTISSYWVTIWIDGLKKIRQYYSEIMIQDIYMKLDNEFGKSLQNLHDDQQYLHSVTLQQLKQHFDFKKSIMYKENYSQKLLYCLLGYVVSENKVNKISIVTNNLIDNVTSLFQMFYNIEDPYMESIRLINDSDIAQYFKQEDEFQEVAENISRQLDNILIKIKRAQYIYNEENALGELTNNIDELLKCGQKINFSVFQENIINKILKILTIFLEQNDLPQYKITINRFVELCACYFQDGNYDYFFTQTSNQKIFSKIVGQYPEKFVSIFVDRCKNREIYINQGNLQNFFYPIYEKYLTSSLQQENATIQSYQVGEQFLELFQYFLNNKNSKHFNFPQNFDIYLQKQLSKSFQKISDNMLNQLSKVNDTNDSLEGAQLSYELKILETLIQAYSSKCYSETFKKIREQFPLKYLTKLINIDNKTFNMRAKFIWIQLIQIFHVDFKNILLDERNTYYFTKPADMQYEEDTFYDSQYEVTLEILIEQFDFIIKANNLNFYSKESLLNYGVNGLFATLVKMMNYFINLKDSNILNTKFLTSYVKPLDNLYIYFQQQVGTLYKIFGYQGVSGKEIQDLNQIVEDNFDIQLAQAVLTKKKEKTKLKYLFSYFKDVSITLMKTASKFVDLNHFSQKMLKKDPILYTNILEKLDIFDESEQVRNNVQNYVFRNLDKKIQKNIQKNISLQIVALYEQNKIRKLSCDISKNIYIQRLKDTSTTESKQMCQNYCSFIHTELKHQIKYMSNHFQLLQILCNTIFHSDQTVLDNLYNCITEDATENNTFDGIWTQMKYSINFIKFKNFSDRNYKQIYLRAALELKFHQLLCYKDNQNFKKLLREKTLPKDTIDRVQRFTTIFQKMSDNCEWHFNYLPCHMDQTDRSIRPHLFPVCVQIFKCLTRCIEGPCLENQKKIYTYIYDRYNGILNRYCNDPDSKFYSIKKSLTEFQLTMAKGLQDDVIKYHSINFQLEKFTLVMINSVKQLYCQKIVKQENESQFINEYTLELEDLEKLNQTYKENEYFRNHDLLEIAVKIFQYIQVFASKKAVFEIYCSERNNLTMEQLQEKCESINEDDLVVYQFLSGIHQDFANKNNVYGFEEMQIENDKDTTQEVIQKLNQLKELLGCEANFILDSAKNELIRLKEKNTLLLKENKELKTQLDYE